MSHFDKSSILQSRSPIQQVWSIQLSENIPSPSSCANAILSWRYLAIGGFQLNAKATRMASARMSRLFDRAEMGRATVDHVGRSVFEAFSTSAALILQHQVSAFGFSSSPNFTCYLTVVKWILRQKKLWWSSHMTAAVHCISSSRPKRTLCFKRKTRRQNRNVFAIC